MADQSQSQPPPPNDASAYASSSPSKKLVYSFYQSEADVSDVLDTTTSNNATASNGSGTVIDDNDTKNDLPPPAVPTQDVSGTNESTSNANAEDTSPSSDTGSKVGEEELVPVNFVAGEEEEDKEDCSNASDNTSRMSNNTSMTKEDAINQLLAICTERGIDVPDSVRSTLTSNNEQATDEESADAASVLTFGLTKIKEDDASIAESVDTLVTGSGINVIASSSSSSQHDLSSLDGSSSRSVAANTGNDSHQTTPTRKSKPPRVTSAYDNEIHGAATVNNDDVGNSSVVNESFTSTVTSTSTASTPSKSRRGCGIMLADGVIDSNSLSSTPRKAAETASVTDAAADSPVRTTPTKADPVPSLCESPDASVIGASKASPKAATPATTCSTPSKDVGDKPASPDLFKRVPVSFGSTVDTSFSSGRGSPFKTQPKQKVGTKSAAGAGDSFYSDGFDENEHLTSSGPSPKRVKYMLALILIVGVVIGVISGAPKAARDNKAAAAGGSTSTTHTEDVEQVEPTPALTPKPTRAPKKDKLKHSPATQAPTTVDEITDPDKYVPGHLTQMKLGVRLSNGLDIRVLANSKKPVNFANGNKSTLKFHERPDYGACFRRPRTGTTNRGGWVYVSNSEIERVASDDNYVSGGVGSIAFNRNGQVVGYDRILDRTDRNCGGGKTPWETFISCEESRKNPPVGQCFQVDPFAGLNKKSQAKTVLGGSKGGSFESFAYDVRNKEYPRFFVTEDKVDGALRRFTPTVVDWENPSQMLHDETGTLEYLHILPTDEEGRRGNFAWITNQNRANRSAKQYYPNSEGLDVADGLLYFVSKTDEDLFILDLDNGTYERKIVKEEGINVSPDQLIRLSGDDGILYLTEDGGEQAGIHGRDSQGRYFTILESPIYKEETTGLAFSPNKKHMYLAYQKNGIVFDVWRKDGKPFDGAVLNTKYHKQLD